MASRQITAVLLGSVALFAVVATCQAALAWEKAKEHPDYPGKCMWDGKIGSLGEGHATYHEQEASWDIGQCIRATCLQLSDGLFIQYASCGVVGVTLPCIVVPGNQTLPYPECCPRPWCPELPQTEDLSLATNEITAESEDNASYYQHTFQF